MRRNSSSYIVQDSSYQLQKPNSTIDMNCINNHSQKPHFVQVKNSNKIDHQINREWHEETYLVSRKYVPTMTKGLNLYTTYCIPQNPIATIVILHGYGDHSGRYCLFKQLISQIFIQKSQNCYFLYLIKYFVIQIYKSISSFLQSQKSTLFLQKNHMLSKYLHLINELSQEVRNNYYRIFLYNYPLSDLKNFIILIFTLTSIIEFYLI